jgi:hypothetical protein
LPLALDFPYILDRVLHTSEAFGGPETEATMEGVKDFSNEAKIREPVTVD